ncbi:MAG: hypothetical protein Fur0017_03880 [Anaerolineales bacterium]
MTFFKDRIPQIQQIIPVFAVTCMMFFGWTTFRFAQKLSSFLLYLQVDEIISVYSYALVTDFLESLIYIIVIVAIGFVLPKRLFRESFIARGSLLSLLGIGYLMYLAIVIGQSKSMEFPWDIVAWAPAWTLGILLTSITLPVFTPLKSVIESFADRAIIFLYILVPLSALSALIVIINQLR